VRAAVRDDFAARLAEAVRQTRIGSNRSTPWWVLVNALHWIAFLAMVAGLGWLLADRLGLVAGVPAAPWSGSLGLPGVAAAGGFAAGLGLWAVGALGARRLGKLRSRKAVARLQSAIELVADEDVVKPVRAELARYERYRSNLASAVG
jgi:hypothetical protein